MAWELRSCQESIIIYIEIVEGTMIANEFAEAVKVILESHVPVQRFVQHKQEPRVDPHCGGADHERHHVRGLGEMVD